MYSEKVTGSKMLSKPSRGKIFPSTQKRIDGFWRSPKLVPPWIRGVVSIGVKSGPKC